MMDEHVNEVHNINGLSSMKPAQKIQVDAKMEFTLPDLQDIEILGPDKREAKITSCYSRCVSRAIVSRTNNKQTANLIDSESQKFMKELSKSAPVNFYNRYKMYLKAELGVDVDNDFTGKWSIIEKCLYKALSKEQNTTRLVNFYNTGHEAFHSKPFELLINDLDTFVDTTLAHLQLRLQIQREEY